MFYTPISFDIFECIPADHVAFSAQVMVRHDNGSTGFEPIYAFGHQDATSTADFIELHVQQLAGPATAKLQV